MKNSQDPSVMQVSSQSTTVGAGLDDPFGAVSTVVCSVDLDIKLLLVTGSYLIFIPLHACCRTVQ